jgi:hypothetical protein
MNLLLSPSRPTERIGEFARMTIPMAPTPIPAASVKRVLERLTLGWHTRHTNPTRQQGEFPQKTSLALRVGGTSLPQRVQLISKPP